MTTAKSKVAIVYGGAEGKYHGKKLFAALKSAGFEVTNKPDDADVLVVHSGGGLLLPPSLRAKLILLVGFPYWPEKPLIKSITQKVMFEFKARPKGLVRKNLHHVFYFLSKPRYLFKMWKVWIRRDFAFPDTPTFVLVHNKNDPFMHPIESLAYGQDRGWHIETLPGSHDDIWSNPRPYIKIIEKYDAKHT